MQSQLPTDDGSRVLQGEFVVKVMDVINISKSIGKQLDGLVDSGRRAAPDDDDQRSDEKEFKTSSCAVYKYLVQDEAGTSRFMILLDVFESRLPQPGATLMLKNPPMSHGVLLCESEHFRQLTPGTKPTSDQLIARLNLELSSS